MEEKINFDDALRAVMSAFGVQVEVFEKIIVPALEKREIWDENEN